MTYAERLNHWAIIRLLPHMQRVVVSRFRSRSDADGYAQAVRWLFPTATFVGGVRSYRVVLTGGTGVV